MLFSKKDAKVEITKESFIN